LASVCDKLARRIYSHPAIADAQAAYSDAMVRFPVETCSARPITGPGSSPGILHRFMTGRRSLVVAPQPCSGHQARISRNFRDPGAGMWAEA
jgi:hypothetical protein